MTRNRKQQDPTVPRGSGDVLFLNYDLSDGERAQFKAWRDANYERLAEFLDMAVEAGYQVSLKRDDFNKCMGAFLIAKATKTENDGWILTGRGSSVVGALFAVLFRHLVLFEGVWPTANRGRQRLDDD